MISKKEYNKKVLIKYFLYFVAIILGIAFSLFLFRVTNVISFFESIEEKTFDFRQKTITTTKQVDKNIVIVSVDDASYEFLLQKYGEWPMPRYVYADITEFIEQQKPAVVAYDLLFVKSLKSDVNSDERLVSLFQKYDNIYTAINFDNQDEQIRHAVDLPPNLRVNIENYSDVNFNNYQITFSNCRAILKEIMNSTSNIGHINLLREEDGIVRRLHPFVNYKDGNYPHLALKVAIDYLNKTEKADIKKIIIDKNNNLVLGNREIPLDAFGATILNWYGKSGEFNPKTYQYVPIWKLEKLAHGEEVADSEYLTNFFRDKIVYFGVSSTSMFDIKSTPIEHKMPGVEVHSTFINNIIDNNFVKRLSLPADISITIMLSLIIGFIVLRCQSTIIASLMTIFIGFIHIVLATLILQEYNIWISIVMPIMFIILTFIGVYLVKYFRKSRDFEHTYKLATTDGLTELYNHRYFQEQMIMNIENSKRYGAPFSLILIDIDYFKKFNDKFGHQSGDAVLKQVAQTLKRNVRSSDIVCRYGGEEMSIILPNTTKEDAIKTAQKICDAVAVRIFDLANNQKEHVTISLGVATYPQDGNEPQALIECADKGLYKAKENGRNQVGII